MPRGPLLLVKNEIVVLRANSTVYGSRVYGVLLCNP